MHRVALLSALVASVAGLQAATSQSIGLMPDGSSIEVIMVPGVRNSAPVVVLIGESAASAADRYAQRLSGQRPFRLLAIPISLAQLRFPPPGKAYRDDFASHYLWRWI